MENNLQLSIPKKEAKDIYKSADATIKKILEASAPKGFFSTNIMDRVNGLSDALAEIGETVESFNERTKGMSLDNIGNEECKVWAKALNEGWEPNWRDRDQPKYYPYHEVIETGSGLGLAYHFICTFFTTSVGSRHLFKSKELAIHAGKHGICSYEKKQLG